MRLHQDIRTGFSRRTLTGAALASVAVGAGPAPRAEARHANDDLRAGFPGAAIVDEPGVGLVALSPRFKRGPETAPVLRHHTDMHWPESPAWHAEGRFVEWAELEGRGAMRLAEHDGGLACFDLDQQDPWNSFTLDREGRRIVFRERARDVVRFEPDDSITVLARRGPHGEFNGPNHGVVHPGDGSIWFADPGYGSVGFYCGSSAPPVPIRKAIWRIDGRTGQVTKVADEPEIPFGLCFDAAYTKLYAVDLGGDNRIWQWDLDGARLRNARRLVGFAEVGASRCLLAIRSDTEGNLWTVRNWGYGKDPQEGCVAAFSSEGEALGLVWLPEVCTNLCFAGTRRDRLFVTSHRSLYSVAVATRGAHFC